MAFRRPRLHLRPRAHVIMYRLGTRIARMVSQRTSVGPEGSSALPIVVVRLDRLGDAVLTTPIFRAIKAHDSQKRTLAICSPIGAEVLKLCPYVDELIVAPQPIDGRFWDPVRQMRSLFRFYKRYLRDRNFDVVINPRYSEDFNGGLFLSALLSGNKLRYYVFDRKIKAFLPGGIDKDAAAIHEVGRGTRLLESIGIQDSRPALALCPSNEDVAWARAEAGKLPHECFLILMAITSSAAHKSWPLQSFAEAVTRLAVGRKVAVGVIHSSAEAETVADFESRIAVLSVPLSGLSLGRLLALCQLADVYIGNDTGPAHLAAAGGCPTVVVLSHWVGGSDLSNYSPVRFGPYGNEARFIQPLSALPGCEVSCTTSVAHCIRSISPAAVVLAAEPFLSESSPRRTALHPSGDPR